MNILQLRNVVKKFPAQTDVLGRAIKHVHAINDVSLEVVAGQTLGLVGESGCGKTTLGRLMMRLIDPTSGEIFFENENISKLSASAMRKKRRDIQMIFQDPFSSLNPRFKISKILSEPFVIHGGGTAAMIEDKVAELLRQVGLPSDAMHKFPHEFSGGQRQRIGIARAIALRPKLVIADEPVSALDVSVQAQILNLLVELKSKLGLSYVFVAHDLAVVEHISDMVAVMYLGKVVEYGDSKTICTSPQHPYTQILIEAVPKISVEKKKKERVDAIVHGEIPSPINLPTGCYFHPRCPKATDICRRKEPQLEMKEKSKPLQLVACHHA